LDRQLDVRLLGVARRELLVDLAPELARRIVGDVEELDGFRWLLGGRRARGGGRSGRGFAGSLVAAEERRGANEQDRDESRAFQSASWDRPEGDFGVLPH